MTGEREAEVVRERRPFDPGRLILARHIKEGLAIIRAEYPTMSDDWIGEWLSGFLGGYVAAAEKHGRSESAEPVR